jgi:polysaccharide export outer membrane protein
MVLAFPLAEMETRGASMRTSSLAAVILCACFVSRGIAKSQDINAPPAAAPYGASDYRLGPDDVLQVFVYKECPDLCVDNLVVRPDGKVSLSLIGELTATGKTPRELETEIVKRLTEFFSEPHVNVIVKEVNSAKVSVLGEVNKPGPYKIGPRSTLLDAIASAGGLTAYAKKDHIIVMRNATDGKKERFELSLDRILRNAKGDPFYVLPYDTIYVQ